MGVGLHLSFQQLISLTGATLMSTAQEPKQRESKVNKAQTYNDRRRADRARRAQRRARTERRWQERRQFKFRVKVVRYYRRVREQATEKRAIALTLARWQPTQPWHFPLCASSIRQWYRTAQREGLAALGPRSKRPHTIHWVARFAVDNEFGISDFGLLTVGN
jgi:hypothetical protein